jgi:plastocyanin
MKLNHALRRPLVIGFTALLSAGCSEHSDAPTGPIGEGGGAVIVVGDFAFSAPTVTIDRGESVRWRSTTSTFHTVTPDGHQAFTERQMNAPGQTLEVRFDAPGRYRYFCEPHRALGMTGEVVVR